MKTLNETKDGVTTQQTRTSNSGLADEPGSSEADQRARPLPSDLILRKAREADLPDILAMIRELAAFENLEQDLEVNAASLRESLLGSHPAAAAIIALLGSRPAGYAIYFHTFSSFVGRPGIFLEDIFVRPSFRRQGIGRALLEEVATIGVRRGCGRFEWIALRWNQEALRFYDSLGARPLDEWVMLRMGSQRMRTLAARVGE